MYDSSIENEVSEFVDLGDLMPSSVTMGNCWNLST